ncbi:hypothetical protein ACP4OV_021009 [Aristida adscensionis]
MAEEGSSRGKKKPDAAAPEEGSSSAPRRVVIICDLNECVGESNNVGTEIPEATEGSSMGNGGATAVAGAVVVKADDDGGSSPASHAVAGQSKGKSPAAGIAAAAAAGAVSSKGKGSASGGGSVGAGGSGGDKPSIVSERDRRNRMSDMYCNLHALLPHVPEKIDKASLVAEAIVYIRSLEKTVAQLERRKRDLGHARQAAAALARAAGASSSSSVHPLPALPMATAVGGSSSSARPPAALPMATAVGGSSSSARPHAALPMATAVGGSSSSARPHAALPTATAIGGSSSSAHHRHAALPMATAVEGSSSSSEHPLPALPMPAAAAAEVTVALPPPAAGEVGFQSWYGPNIVLSVSNDDAYITVCMPRRASLMSMVVSVLDKYGIDVVTAQVSSDSGRSMFNVHARVTPEAGIQQADPPLSSVDIYKLAVSELMVWLYD